MYSKNGEHILTFIGQGVKLTGFGFSREKMDEYDYIDVIGTMKSTIYRNMESLDFVIKEAMKAKYQN